MQSKRLYAWEVAPVDDKALAVLCGDIVDFKVRRLSLSAPLSTCVTISGPVLTWQPAAGSLVLDRKIRYSLLSKSGIAIKLLRQHFAQALNTRLRGKKWSEQQEAWFELGVRCLSAANDLDEEQVGIVGL
jgi:ATP-dependent RNA helicase DHX29